MTPGEQPAELEALTTPGPIRSAAVAALARRLRIDLSVCRDRSVTIAGAAVDDLAAAAIAKASSSSAPA